MINRLIRFRCRHCEVRIKAPLKLNGRRRPCPRCLQPVKVPSLVKKRAKPVIVLADNGDHFSLQVKTKRRSA